MIETVEKALEAKGLLPVPHSGVRHARAVVMVEPGGARHVRADAVGLGEVPVRLPEMSVGAEEVEPLRHVEPVASTDDDKIRLGKRTADANRFRRFHALPPQRLAHVGEHIGDVGANGEPPVLDRAGEKLRLVVHGDVASLRQLRREGPERLLDKRRRDAAHNICRRADINRGTFYLHYEDKFALLDALIDEALAAAPPLEGTETGALCQRPPANDDYYLLYSDDDAYTRVAQRVVERGAEQMVPSIMEESGLSREDAYLLFVHNVQGNLAVNRLLGWRRGPEFAHAQELLGAYSEGGLRAVSSRHDSRSSS